MNKKILRKMDTALGDVIYKLVMKDPSVLSKKTSNGVQIGDIMVKRGNHGADIYKQNKKLYSDIQESNAVQAIVNRLTSNSRIKDITAILKLESDYVRTLNDILFIKHRYNGLKDENDKQICEHRLLIAQDKLYEIKSKLSAMVNL